MDADLIVFGVLIGRGLPEDRMRTTSLVEKEDCRGQKGETRKEEGGLAAFTEANAESIDHAGFRAAEPNGSREDEPRGRTSARHPGGYTQPEWGRCHS